MQTIGARGNAVASGIDVREPAARLKLFISYSHYDLGIADTLVGALEGAGFEVKIDRRNLPYGEEWQGELTDFVRGSDTVVWLVSQHSIKSKWCNWELGEVLRLKKRLVPVAIAATEPDELPEALGRIHMLPPSGAFSITTHFPELVKALNTNRAWVKTHTLLADRAYEWLAANRGRELLLRGKALAAAELWAKRSPAGEKPAAEVLDLILASRQEATRRGRYWLGGAFGIAACSIALAGYAVLKSIEADDQRDIALNNAAIASKNEKQAQRAQSLAQAELSRRNAEEGNIKRALELALEALPADISHPVREYAREAQVALFYSVLAAAGETSTAFKHDGDVRSATFDPSGLRVATASSDKKARIWDAATGKRLKEFPHAGPVRSISFSRDGKKIVTACADGAARVWDSDKEGEPSLVLKHGDVVTSAQFNLRGDRIVTTSFDRTSRLWDANTGKELWKLDKPSDRQQSLLSAAFSPLDPLIVTSSYGRRVRLWDSSTGSEQPSQIEHGQQVHSAEFNSDGTKLVTASADRTVRIWDMAKGDEVATLRGHKGIVLSAAFSNDGTRIISASTDGTARLWDVTTKQEIGVLHARQGTVFDAAFSPDGRSVIIASADNTARIWKVVFPADQELIAYARKLLPALKERRDETLP